MGKEVPKYTPKEMAEIEKSRTLSDAELLKDGAEYKIAEKGEKELAPTAGQVKEARKEMKEELKRMEPEKRRRWLEELESRGQVARDPKEINENTKVYVGRLEPGIFTELQKYNVEHIYTSFPENPIYKETIEIGGVTTEKILQKMNSQKIRVDSSVKDIMKSKEFAIRKNPEQVNLIRLMVKDLFPEDSSEFVGHTFKDFYRRAEELGLELSPAEVGPHYRIKYQDQPKELHWKLSAQEKKDEQRLSGQRVEIAMKPIVRPGSAPGSFFLVNEGGHLRLGVNTVNLDSNAYGEFVFRLPAKGSEQPKYTPEQMAQMENRDKILKIIKQEPQLLQYFAEQFRGDKEVVLEAVKKSGWALSFASKELRGDKDVVLEAVKENGLALQYASKELREDGELRRIAAEQLRYI